MPAVSTNIHVCPSSSIASSTGSRVVPAVGSTTTRSDPASLFKSEDLPTFGLPRRATRRGPSGRASATAERSGRAASTASSRSPVPRPCRAEIGCGSPRPSPHSAAASDSCIGESTLFAARTTGRLLRRSSLTMSASASVIPTFASTTSTTASAACIAASAWRATEASMPATSISQPPVSTSVKSRPAQDAG